MDKDKVELKSIIVCGQSDGYLKKWAEEELGKLDIKEEFKVELVYE